MVTELYDICALSLPQSIYLFLFLFPFSCVCEWYACIYTNVFSFTLFIEVWSDHQTWSLPRWLILLGSNGVGVGESISTFSG